MAIESVAITAGTTDAIAVDTVGTINYQVNKISIAPDGAGGTLWDGKTQGGTIDAITNVAGGSIVVTAGTIAAHGITAGTLQTIGTIGTVQNVNGGSIVVTAGTIGTITTQGTIGTIQNINGGSIVVTAGTVAAHGITAGTLQTLGTVGTIQNIAGGSIVVTAGTVTTSISNLGTVGTVQNINGGSIIVTAGTAVGNIASGATDSGNPVKLGGVFQGTAGTVTDGQRVNLQTDNVGNLKVYLATKLDSTNDSVTVGGGSVVVTAGTVTTTISNLGTVGTIQNINGGSIVVTAGTIGTITTQGTVGTIQNINGGSIVVTAGTITGGTIKENFAAIGTATITLGTLATSTTGVGRQSTIIDNTSNLYSGAIVAAHVTAGTVTAANNMISLYLIRGDNGGGPIQDDKAGASDASWTQANAPLLGNIVVNAVGTNVAWEGVFDTSGLGHLGPKWGIGVVHNLGNPLHATAGSHSITYTQYNAKF